MHSLGMLTAAELLARLNERGVKNADIARALKVTPSRITEMKKGERRLLLDEAVKLVEVFELESPQGHPASPLPAPIARLVVQYVSHELGANLEGNQDQLEELAQDIRAFAEFVADPSVRESVEAAEAFFQAMRLRRPKPAKEAQSESDPLPVR